MSFSPHSRSNTRKSNVALLLQPMLHNFGALAPINHLDGMTYQLNPEESRKSNVALLLPLFVLVSPLLRYSYKKMGGAPLPSVHSAPSAISALMLFPSLPFNCQPLTFNSLLSSRPYPPLPKSFVFNTVTKLPQKAPLSNSFRISHFQTSRKAPLSKSFRIIALQKQGVGGTVGFVAQLGVQGCAHSPPKLS
jgi:hypothetical protein